MAFRDGSPSCDGSALSRGARFHIIYSLRYGPDVHFTSPVSIREELLQSVFLLETPPPFWTLRPDWLKVRVLSSTLLMGFRGPVGLLRACLAALTSAKVIVVLLLLSDILLHPAAAENYCNTRDHILGNFSVPTTIPQYIEYQFLRVPLPPLLTKKTYTTFLYK